MIASIATKFSDQTNSQRKSGDATPRLQGLVRVPDKEQEYFSDGLVEEILNLVAKIPDLKVIAISGLAA